MESPYSPPRALSLDFPAVFQLPPVRTTVRHFALLAIATALCVSTASARPDDESSSLDAILSPLPEPVAPREALRVAEDLLATYDDCEVMFGLGGSMLPLYPDRTILIVRRLPMSELRSGMTVVFVGDRGRPVAHTLQKRTLWGWKVKGLANAEADRTLVKDRNYLGTVIRAFTPVLGLADGVFAGTGNRFSGAR